MLTGQHMRSRVEALQQGLGGCSLLWPHQICLVEQNDICKLYLQAPPNRLQMLHKSNCRNYLRCCWAGGMPWGLQMCLCKCF